MSLRLPDARIAERLHTVRVPVAGLVRLSRQPATEPWWSRGVYRFDDPTPDAADGFGVCYAGGSVEVAFAESVIHESSRFAHGRYEVPLADLLARHAVSFAHPQRKTLHLADLTGAALKALGLNNDISAGDDYALPQAWARAIHTGTTLDGIRYVSRQMNKGFAFAVFDRSGLRRARAAPLSARQLDALCDRFNVAAV